MKMSDCMYGVLGMLIFVHLVTKIFESSLPCLEGPSTEHFPEAVKFTPHTSCFLKKRFNIIFTPTLRIFRFPDYSLLFIIPCMLHRS